MATDLTAKTFPGIVGGREEETVRLSAILAKNSHQLRHSCERRIDWTNLLRTAHAHGTVPLLYRQLNESYRDLVPRAILNQLGEHYHDNIRRNFLLSGQLLGLLKLFDAHGISAMPFKGLTLAACAYGNLALRDIGDLDLFIRKRDMAKAAELLLANGYGMVFKLNSAQEAAHLASIGQLPFGHKNGAGLVELHTTLMPREFFFPLDFERVWGRHITLSLSGKKVPSLCPEDLLLVLSAHGTKHHWICLKWICDIAYLINSHPRMDWNLVLQEAHRLASQRMLHLGLLLAEKLLQAPVPQAIRQEIQTDAVVQALGTQVIRNLLRPADTERSGFGSALFHLRARERLRDGIRYSASMVLAPTLADWESVPLPPFLYSLYYLLRPIRLAALYGQKLLSHFNVGNRHARAPV
jgi:hypothetical protein